jgi:ribosomal protein S18 acetylase RimI-like enzyme
MRSTTGMGAAIRSGLQPGDIGEITRLHGEIYAAEHGLDATFEASVAGGLARLVEQGWPSEREGVWMVEAKGERVGCALLYERAGFARMGMVVLRPEQRGAGLGRRLVDLCLERARSAGYAQVELLTFSDLEAAIHLYRDAGFRRVSAEPQVRFGRELIWERYLLDL